MLLVVPLLWLLAEIAAAVAVAHAVGVLVCVLLLVAGWPVGMVVMRAEGRATLRRLRTALAEGRAPGDGAGALALLAGPLLVVPGFLTDVLAGLLLIPTVRRGLVSLLVRRFGGGRASGGGARSPFDVEGTAHETAPPADPTPFGQLRG